MYTRRKMRVGVVTSDKMQKTVVVAVESHKSHRLYKKTMRRTTHYKVHDAQELAKVGDIVRIVESRPLSREKRWRLVEVVMRREVAEIAPREIDASLLGISRPHTEHGEIVAAEAPVEAPPAEAEAEAGAVAEEQAPPEAEAETAVEEVPPPEAKPEPQPAGSKAKPEAETEAEAEPEAEAPSNTEATEIAEEVAPEEAEPEVQPAESEAEPEAEAKAESEPEQEEEQTEE